MIFYKYLIIFMFASSLTKAKQHPDLNRPQTKVNKCCEPYEILLNNSCVHINKTNETNSWHPIFATENGKSNIPVEYILLPGSPDCGSMQQWPIYYYKNSTDVLRLLPNGVLRHYLFHIVPGEDEETGYDIINGKELIYHDYPPGKYCMEKHIENNLVSEYAIVCAPEHHTDWTSTPYLMRNIINPITHGISMACFLAVAVIYFIMPTLRDLVGNIITTISMCLIIHQAADMTRLLTVFTNHVSIIIAETVCYLSLLGAFFWLNSLGYYIWKTFRSRNVFLRITDGKKYCYYSLYVWTCTIVMGILALFAHFTLDYPQTHEKRLTLDNGQATIGSLAIIIFFVPVFFIVLVNLFFFATTMKILRAMNTYGRIHHKLKHSFRMFMLLLLIMTITWLFFLPSFSKYDGLVYCYIIVNAVQAPLFLYICIFNQKHVSFLVRKTCCYANCSCCRPEPECEWGDEMAAMNTGMY